MRQQTILITVLLLLCQISAAHAIRPFQIADDADAEDPGLWELEFGFLIERVNTEDSDKTVIEFPGEIDIDYGLPWNAEIGFDFRTQVSDTDGDDIEVEPVSELALFYKQEFKTWEFDKLDVQTGGEVGVDFPTTEERRETNQFNLPGFFALSLWRIYDRFDLHFLIEGEIEETGDRNDLKFAFGTFINYPLPFHKKLRLVAEYGWEKVEEEPFQHLVLGGIDWENPFKVIEKIGGEEIEFDVASFIRFTEDTSTPDWGITAGFEWVWDFQS